MSHNDAVNCPEHDTQKMKIVQGAPFIHEGVLAYWRRKKCLKCGHIMKTVEVPADCVASFFTNPRTGEMS